MVKSFGSFKRLEENEDGGFADERRWDSEMRRRSSRSWARREGASSGSVDEEDCVFVVAEGLDVAV